MGMTVIGTSFQRKEAWDKVTGAAKYNDDYINPGTLHAKMLTSNHAHAVIKSIDVSEAEKSPGVQAVVTGRDAPVLCGTILADRPPIAINRVRYFGEPVAVVVANSEFEAAKAVQLIKVDYKPLPVVNSPGAALAPDAPLIHKNLAGYKHIVRDIYPEPGTNVANRIKISKGDMAKGWAECDKIVEENFLLPQSDHIAMETRSASAQIMPGGQVVINSSTQGPFAVREVISRAFNLEKGDVVVNAPLVGGGFGGKAPIQLELIAYIASRAAKGKKVKIVNTRGEDIITSPCRMGLEACVKIGASNDGMLKAIEMIFLMDTGAYTDIGPRIAKSIAVDCTGPYKVDNVKCESVCVYTNHPYVTSFRAFGHLSYTFCIERTLDKLAFALNTDPLELRCKNAIKPGDTTPTQVKVTASNTGNLTLCLEKMRNLINWNEGMRIVTGNKVRSKGLSCFWKTSDSPTDAVSGVFLTFNEDGSINLNFGAVEFGPGMKTNAAQILAERMKMDVNRIHVLMEVNTKASPKHWKTVASMTTYMAGRAVLRAGDDLIRQLTSLAGTAMRVPPEDLVVANEKVYLRHDPNIYISFKDLVHGFKYPNGNAVEGQILGRGSFIMGHLTSLDRETGKGKPGPAWSVGVQAVEVEFDPGDCTYRLLKAATVIDAGKVINPNTAKGLIMGGMCMGLGVGSREAFSYDKEGRILTTSIRTYKMMHFGETPEYLVEFVETPQEDAPYGARGIAEHGVIGMPAALANALSSAAQTDLNHLPLIPDYIWTKKTGGAV